MDAFLAWYDTLAEFLEGRDPLFFLLECCGTFAAAVSGIRLASIKRFDWFGAYVIGFVTAIGGGTSRDLLLSLPPFWTTDPIYLVCTFAALLVTWVFGRRVIDEPIAWFVFDTIGLSLFTVIGLQKSFAFGHPWWVAITMGTITGACGGVVRDIFINEVPLIFRKDFYALPCVFGGFLYCALRYYGMDDRPNAIICMLFMFLLRGLAIRFHFGMPVFSGRKMHFGSRHRSPPHDPVEH